MKRKNENSRECVKKYISYVEKTIIGYLSHPTKICIMFSFCKATSSSHSSIKEIEINYIWLRSQSVSHASRSLLEIIYILQMSLIKTVSRQNSFIVIT